MKRTAEFWMRISITLFFILLVLSAPIIFFPFGISLILSILLTPLAQKLYKWINMSIELGKSNQLEVVKEVDFGVYLDGGEEGEILLPTRYVPEDCKIGDFLNVFLYLDMDERD